jgi:hypothetical protein
MATVKRGSRNTDLTRTSINYLSGAEHTGAIPFHHGDIGDLPTASNSTSNTNFAFGEITPGTPCSPVSRVRTNLKSPPTADTHSFHPHEKRAAALDFQLTPLFGPLGLVSLPARDPRCFSSFDSRRSGTDSHRSAILPDIATLLMSGYTDRAIRMQEELSNGTPFIQKPFTPRALALKIREVVVDQAESAKKGRRSGLFLFW